MKSAKRSREVVDSDLDYVSSSDEEHHHRRSSPPSSSSTTASSSVLTKPPPPSSSSPPTTATPSSSMPPSNTTTNITSLSSTTTSTATPTTTTTTTTTDHHHLGKRFKQTVDAVAEQFVCPITLELPINPVTAEDGNIYERSAIERCAKTQGASFKSPCTNEPMGRRLLPAPKTRNAIESLVQSGVIRDDIARAWKQRLSDSKDVEDAKRRAARGDAVAMRNLGAYYYIGEKGLEEDEAEGYKWYRRSADLGDVEAMTLTGFLLAHGSGVNSNISEAMYYLSGAAHLGSDLAACILGKLYWKGEFGMPRDQTKAKVWFGKVVRDECQYKHADEEMRNDAAKWLRELTAEKNEEDEEDEEEED